MIKVLVHGALTVNAFLLPEKGLSVSRNTSAPPVLNAQPVSIRTQTTLSTMDFSLTAWLSWAVHQRGMCVSGHNEVGPAQPESAPCQGNPRVCDVYDRGVDQSRIDTGTRGTSGKRPRTGANAKNNNGK
jgi:hypothetical protein